MRPIDKLAAFVFADDSDELSTEELIAEAEEIGVNLPRLSANVDKMVADTLARLKQKQKVDSSWRNKLDEFNRSLGTVLGNQRMISLSSVGVVLADNQTDSDRNTNMCEISLSEHLNAQEISENLSWIGKSLYIGRVILKDKPDEAVYTAQVEVDDATARNSGSLIIGLKADDGREASTLLSAESPSATVFGDSLPADWTMIQFKLAINNGS